MKNFSYTRLRGWLIAICLVSLFAPLTAWAQDESVLVKDPAGRSQLKRLQQKYQEAGEDPHGAAFLELFLENPNLSRRAFASAIVVALESFESHPEETKRSAEFALLLATVISEQFGEPTPLEICQMVGDGKPESLRALTDYLSAQMEVDGSASAASSGSSSGLARYGEDTSRASDYPPQAFDLIRPILTKLMRIQYATAVASPELTVTELDSYAAVASALDANLASMGVSPSVSAELQSEEIRRGLTLRKLTVLAEIGLLREFEEGSKELIKDETDPLYVASILLTGYRAAYRQNLKDKAQDYLEKARAIIDQSTTPSDPVLDYAIRSAEYQLRRLNGFRPNESEVVAEFQTAWSALDGYRPLKIVQHEANWYYGRLATRYWMDELAPFPNASREQAAVVLTRLITWADALSTFDALGNLTNDDTLLHSDEFFGSTIFALSLVDQITYLLESFPEEMQASGDLSAMVGQLEDMANAFVEIQETLGLSKEGPGFPPYDVRDGGLVPELLARCRYLDGLAGNGTTESRVASLADAIAMIGKSKNPEVTVDYLLKAGRQMAELGQPDQALSAWKEALTMADDLRFVHRSIEASSLLAKEYGRRGDWKTAAFYADRASDKIEVAAPLLGMSSAEGREMTLRSQEVTSLAVKAHIETDDPEKAMATLNRSQQVQSAAAQMEGQKEAQAEVQGMLRQEEQVVTLAHKVKALEEMPASATRNSLLKSTQNLMADTKAKFLLESRLLRQKYSDLYTRVLKFDPLNLPDIQKSLPDNLAVVQYFPTDDALYVFVVTSDSFRLRSVPVTEKVLSQTVASFLRSIRRVTPNDAKMAQESTRLHELLIAPVLGDIVDKPILVLIPSGRLNSLPFACLTDTEGAPLVTSRQLLELAKPTDLMRVVEGANKPVESVVAFANATGDLPAASVEGQRITQLFPHQKLFDGKQATRKNFFEFGGKAEVLHLATHGQWYLDDSLKNSLALAGNETVAQDEIFNLGLEETSLTVLSACDTANGEGGEVKYVASLAEAFWIAGSRSVVASLWAVSDDSTSVLMTEFYTRLRAGDSKVEALRGAQAKVRSMPEYQHPFYWSGFILFGDWR